MIPLLACVAVSEPEPVPPLPDVVLVVVETWRADRVGRMPFVQSLAARGRTYEQAWSPAPWTLPSVTSMMTGAWPHETGVVRTEHGLDEEWTTLAESMSARGYQTAFLGVNELFTHERGLEQGYDSFVAGTGWSADRVRQELKGLERDGRPLFLHLHLFEPHCPYWAPRSHRFTLEVEGEERVDPELLAAAPDCHRLADGEDRLGAWFARYDEELIALDGQLERILRPYEGARLVLVGDHGESLWEEGLIGHGEHLVDPALRVPLLVVEPGEAPRTLSEPISGREVYRLVQGEAPEAVVLTETSQVQPRACRVLLGDPTLCSRPVAVAPLLSLAPDQLQALEALGYTQVVPSPLTGEP